MPVAAMISADAATELLARGAAVGAFLALAISVAQRHLRKKTATTNDNRQLSASFVSFPKAAVA
jgi:hypothetical protein